MHKIFFIYIDLRPVRLTISFTMLNAVQNQCNKYLEVSQWKWILLIFVKFSSHCYRRLSQSYTCFSNAWSRNNVKISIDVNVLALCINMISSRFRSELKFTRRSLANCQPRSKCAYPYKYQKLNFRCSVYIYWSSR